VLFLALVTVVGCGSESTRPTTKGDAILSANERVDAIAALDALKLVAPKEAAELERPR